MDFWPSEILVWPIFFVFIDSDFTQKKKKKEENNEILSICFHKYRRECSNSQTINTFHTHSHPSNENSIFIFHPACAAVTSHSYWYQNQKEKRYRKKSQLLRLLIFFALISMGQLLLSYREFFVSLSLVPSSRSDLSHSACPTPFAHGVLKNKKK